MVVVRIGQVNLFLIVILSDIDSGLLSMLINYEIVFVQLGHGRNFKLSAVFLQVFESNPNQIILERK